MYVSFNDGASWQPFQMNLPIVPITDLAIKDNNLIAATQGRSFWLLDDLTPLHQLSDAKSKAYYLYKPMDSYRMGGGNGMDSKTDGTNHPGGVIVNYFVKDTAKTDTIRISFHEADGDVIKTFSTHPDKEAKEEKLSVAPGFNSMNWDMEYLGAKTFEGMIMWWATTSGPTAIPGAYKVKMSVNGADQIQDFSILADPRAEASAKDYQDQFDFLINVRDKLTEAHEGIINIRKAKTQINDVLSKVEDNEELTKYGMDIIEEMSEIEKTIYQTKNESIQDPLNFPIRLNNKLGHLASLEGIGNYPPTDASLAFYQEVSGEIDEQLAKLNDIFGSRIDEFNKMVKAAEIDAVKLEE